VQESILKPQLSSHNSGRDPHPVAPVIGLTEQEAENRRRSGQGNNIRLQTSRTYWQILSQNLFTFLNNVLLAIGAVLVALGLYNDAITSVGLVFLNVIIGVSQEFRAKRKLDQIALLTRPKATVMRDGVPKTLDPSEIVLGDFIVANPGDQIVVDGEIMSGKMDVDESLLTGESDLIPKSKGDKVMSGSYAVTGSAVYEAQKVGAESYANKLTESARAFRVVKTPLQKDIDFVIRMLILLATLFGVLFGASFLIRQASAADSARMAAVIAGLVPNGLFFMIVAAYAMGALRMSGQGALIQQVNSVESMANVNVLCLDKTGTLTANHIHLDAVYPLDIGQTQLEYILAHYVASVSASNRTSEAIAEVYKGEALPIVDEVTFSSALKWSALAFDTETLKGIYALGAPEMLEPHLKDPLEKAQIAQWTDQGLRVLLLAHSTERLSLHDSLGQPGLPQGMTPLGLLTFSDELRPEAKETLENFASVGIKLKIISGDNPHTVASLAKQAGLGKNGELRVVSGTELDALDDAALASVAEETTIFGRIRPDQKERLIAALRSRGNYVAMIGDGVNDVLSLKKAQIGIAMQSGSAATRGVADIILMGDSFGALPSAFIEGQRIINGMQDVVRLFLTRVFYVALLIFGTAVIASPQILPMTPTQSALLTFLTVGIPTFALAAWARPGVFKGRIVVSVIRFVVPAAMSIAGFGLFLFTIYLLRMVGASAGAGNVLTLEEEQLIMATARTALLNFLTTAGIILIIFAEPPNQFWAGGDEVSGDWRPTFLAIGMFICLVLVNLIPSMRDVFELQVLPLQDYLFIGGIVLIWTILMRYVWRTRVFDRFLGLDAQE
jgi:cation-transporting P-type ATPase E